MRDPADRGSGLHGNVPAHELQEGRPYGWPFLQFSKIVSERALNELAERVGISNVNLSKIKNNKVTAVRFTTLAVICEVLDCEAGDILEFQKDD